MITPLNLPIARDRAKAAAGVAALHLLAGYFLVTGLGTKVSSHIEDELKTFNVPQEPPPRPEPPPLPEAKRAPKEEGAASPPNLKSRPTPVVAPPPKVKLKVPPPLTSAPKPSPITGNDLSAGASDVPGPGTGSGGIGTGTGSGRGGTGPGGGGGGGSRAIRLSGAIHGPTDYPRQARREGVEGSVAVEFTVMPDGSVRHCNVLRSTASEELEWTTCRLIERRFRYEPARDAEGKPRAERVRRTFDWSLPGRRY